VEAALLAGLDPAQTPPRTSVRLEHGELLLMPAESPTGVGVKLVTIGNSGAEGAERINGVYVLFDKVTLKPVAQFDGAALTTLRTPAVSAVAVDHLAPADASQLVVFGNGPQARGHVEALQRIRPITDVVTVTRSLGDPAAVAEADIVVCATTARTPLFDGALLKENACVVAIGSHEPGTRELDDTVFRRAARVVVEDVTTALREAGDVIQAIAAGALTPSALIDLRRVVALQPEPGITVFKGVGMGWQDLVVAEAMAADTSESR
jgi:ornithine cyclodeaminase/alanine dehydrogenase-like protein (mu-crystallin family)